MTTEEVNARIALLKGWRNATQTAGPSTEVGRVVWHAATCGHDCIGDGVTFHPYCVEAVEQPPDFCGDWSLAGLLLDESGGELRYRSGVWVACIPPSPDDGAHDTRSECATDAIARAYLASRQPNARV